MRGRSFKQERILGGNLSFNWGVLRHEITILEATSLAMIHFFIVIQGAQPSSVRLTVFIVLRGAASVTLYRHGVGIAPLVRHAHRLLLHRQGLVTDLLHRIRKERRMHGLYLRSHRDERLRSIHDLIRNLNLLWEHVVLHLRLRSISCSKPHQVRHGLSCEL